MEKNVNHADLHGVVKILTAAARMKGEALVLLSETVGGEKYLLYALQRAREIEFVEEELPALRALATLEKLRGNLSKAKEYLQQSWHLATRGDFKLYNADSYNILAQVEMAEGNRKKAIKAAQKAFDLSNCDGIPFAYQRGLEDSTNIFNILQTILPKILTLKTSSELSVEEINPKDEFYL